MRTCDRGFVVSEQRRNLFVVDRMVDILALLMPSDGESTKEFLERKKAIRFAMIGLVARRYRIRTGADFSIYAMSPAVLLLTRPANRPRSAAPGCAGSRDPCAPPPRDRGAGYPISPPPRRRPWSWPHRPWRAWDRRRDGCVPSYLETRGNPVKRVEAGYGGITRDFVVPDVSPCCKLLRRRGTYVVPIGQ